MPKVKYIIKLSETEKEQLKKIEKDPKSKARTQKRARILLLIEANPKWTNQQVADAVLSSKRMIENTKKKCVEEGVMECLYDNKKREPIPRKPKQPQKLEFDYQHF
jgi:dephospho-CoA kinase